MTSAAHDSVNPRYVASALLALTVCAMLVMALRPFHSPKNQVAWVQNEDAVSFGRNGTILSSGEFRFAGSEKSACSLEVWFEPALTWTRGTILSFYDPLNPATLLLYQNYANLVVRRGAPSQINRGKPPQIVIEGLLRKRQIFLTVTSDGQNISLYVNGQLATRKTEFGLSAQDLSGQLILANSPLRNSSWSGQLRGLAIYNKVLGAPEVAQRYKDWTQGRQSSDATNGMAIAFFAFREHEGRTIRDEGTSGIGLFIPERFQVVTHLFLEPPWSEIYADHDYFDDALYNIAGFVPLGFVLAGFLTVVMHRQRPTLAAMLLGGSLSLLFEILQAYVPTRFSGMTDIITNTLGTALGAGLYSVVAHMYADNPNRLIAKNEK